MSLCLQEVRHSYALTEVLGGVSLALAPGAVLALVGPSGCGKTTLLHLCAGLLTLQDGRLRNRFACPALMFQQPRLLPWQTCADNIALGLRAQGMTRAEARSRAHAIGQLLGLDGAALAAYPHQLSGGMQSRAALARALVLQPDLLLMDEPFAALDIGLKAQLHRLLLRHQAEQGTAVLMITHDLMEAVRLADTVLVMAAGPGRVVHQYTPPGAALARTDATVYHDTAELLRVPAVRAAFGLDALQEASCG
ncbi:ABC transporter ATP-binding protein [Simplicispira psychrophila]|uniref:ABC transporter ATP-binding protein n=1 Tax=Simplicispira psychrophila TaxID=80882 RepID=UPI0006899B3D|nr:ATP-binding cassette domain-containing protein [Simplicispira psychrophila]